MNLPLTYSASIIAAPTSVELSNISPIATTAVSVTKPAITTKLIQFINEGNSALLSNTIDNFDNSIFDSSYSTIKGH